MTETHLPSFVVIGAVKAATTWTAHQLRLHPRLWLPDTEPHYFSSEFHRGPDWYRSLFNVASADRMIGEKSADYLAHPDAAERLSAASPHVRLVVQLRDPVQRAYSDYCMLYRRGMVGGSPSKYLSNPTPEQARFLQGGLYAEHIERWLRHFSREQLMTVLVEDIEADPAEVVARVCRHIGVEPHSRPAALTERKNDSTAPMLPLAMRRALRPLRPLLDPLRSNPVLARLRASLAAPVHYPPLTPELRGWLHSFYQADILRTAELVGRDLDQWLIKGASRQAAA